MPDSAQSGQPYTDFFYELIYILKCLCFHLLTRLNKYSQLAQPCLSEVIVTSSNVNINGYYQCLIK